MTTTLTIPKEACVTLTIRLPVGSYERLAEQAARDFVRPSTAAQRVLVRALRRRRSVLETAST